MMTSQQIVKAVNEANKEFADSVELKDCKKTIFVEYANSIYEVIPLGYYSVTHEAGRITVKDKASGETFAVMNDYAYTNKEEALSTLIDSLSNALNSAQDEYNKI